MGRGEREGKGGGEREERNASLLLGNRGERRGGCGKVRPESGGKEL